MQPAIRLRRRLEHRQPTLGVLLTNHIWLELIEICRDVGIDYVIIDVEHFQHDPQRIADVCAFGRATHYPVLLRPARTDAASIRCAMDLGPCGLLLPMIETVEQLDDVVQGAYLPPRGTRRPGGPGNRWVKSFSYQTFRVEIEDHLIVIPQIESQRGLRNAGAVASHPITTALGVGPFDLSASLGACWSPAHPDFVAALESLRLAAADADKPLWMIGDPTELARDGHRFLCLADPSSLLEKALSQVVMQVSQVCAGNDKHPSPIVKVEVVEPLPVFTGRKTRAVGGGNGHAKP